MSQFWTVPVPVLANQNSKSVHHTGNLFAHTAWVNVVAVADALFTNKKILTVDQRSQLWFVLYCSVCLSADQSQCEAGA